MHKVFFVGPLPPPVHGFAVINDCMLGELQVGNSPVYVFDLSPRTLFSPMWEWLKFIVQAVRPTGGFIKTLYLPISGGIRQLIDLSFAVPAKLLGFRLFVHHHSYAYLNSKPWFSSLTFWLLKDATHIVLCADMGRRLCAQYGISPKRLRVLSNAGFLKTEASDPIDTLISHDGCTLGFLSNITLEKGIFKFFDALEALSSRKIPFNALVAGPVDPNIKSDFEARLSNTPGVRHVGSVYGESKKQFYRQIDVLLFPTLYANEAEPVSILEAMSYSVPVIALQRGCILGMVPKEAGTVVENPNDFNSAVIDEVTSILDGSDYLPRRRMAARASFEQAYSRSSLTLATLMKEMTLSTDDVIGT